MEVNSICPSFTLKNQYNEDVNLEDLLGQHIIVLFFYPKDNTAGCTKEACSFRDAHEEFLSVNCTIIGISGDSVSSHKEFASKHHLPYTILSDPEHTVRKLFKVPSHIFGLIPGRVTYVIGKDKKIKGVYNALMDPVGHITHAMNLVKELSASTE